jgi:hypothetical protein
MSTVNLKPQNEVLAYKSTYGPKTKMGTSPKAKKEKNHGEPTNQPN